MQGLLALWQQADAVGRVVALLLLGMSVATWVLIAWKLWLLRRIRRDLALSLPAFWAAPSLEQGQRQLQTLDRERLLLPLLQAVAEVTAPAPSLHRAGALHSRLTRGLRDALQRGRAPLHAGQVVLASVGSTAPFVGLFGTVWGVYNALLGMAAAGGASIDRVAGPIGEALVMTAAGIAVAVPAVLAYNAFGQWAAAREAELEGFAHDLRDLLLDLHGAGPDPSGPAPERPGA